MTEDEIGYICICGKRVDKNGNEITKEQVDPMKKEAGRIVNRKNYRFKYPNINDSFVRVAPVIMESETTDETESDVSPSKKDKEK